MGWIRPGPPGELLLRLAAAGGAETFVETGTFRGETAMWAARHLKSVITIELRPEISRAAAAHPACPKNIEFLSGDSAELLPGVVARLGGPAVFWLDGHYSGPGTGDESRECPLLDELRAVANSRDPIIAVDDARCFLGPPPPPHDPKQWPRIDEVFALVRALCPRHATTIVDDVILAVPAALRQIVDADWQERYPVRYPAPTAREKNWFERARRVWSGKE